MSGKYGEDTWKPGKLKPGFRRPVMIHRALLGSVERIMAVLCEHTCGKWPFFLSPRQMIVCPVSEKFISYAEKVAKRLDLEGFNVELDRSNDTLNKKIRNAQLHQWNLILVVGELEEKEGSVTVRNRDDSKVVGKMSIPEFLKYANGLLPQASGAEKKMWLEAYYHPSVTLFCFFHSFC